MSFSSQPLRPAAEGELRDLVPDEAALKALAPENRGPTLLGHPPGLFLLFLVEMWERFSYYGMRGLLVLYLSHEMAPAKNPGRGWPESDANLLYGWYTGLAYLFPLLGGFLADKFLGTHRSMLIGGIIIALGHVVLAISGVGALGASALGISIFIAGLALIIVGTGYFKPCVSVMVGQLYGPDDPRRDGAFTIFYMGINLGAFICAFVCGTLGEKVGWHWGFGAAAVGMLAGLFVYLLARPTFLPGIGLPPAGQPNVAPLFLLVSLLPAVAVGAFYHVGGFGWILAGVKNAFSNQVVAIAISTVLTVVVLGWVAWFISVQRSGEKGPTAAIFIYMCFNAFFWFAFEQAGSTLNLFAEKDTNRHLSLWEVPATWFQSVNPALILLLAPFFAAMWSYLARRGRDPSQAVKIGLGLLLLGAGYLFIVAAARLRFTTGLPVAMFWLLATYTLHTFGELCLSPTGLSFVTKAAPAKYVSLLMGIWFISSFTANLGGGIVASFAEKIEKGEVQLFWYRWFRLGGRADFFLIFVISSFATGLLILLLTPLLRRLTHGRE